MTLESVITDKHLALFPISAKAQAPAGLSWLYSLLINHPHPPGKLFFSAAVHIVKQSREPKFKLATQKQAGS